MPKHTIGFLLSSEVPQDAARFGETEILKLRVLSADLTSHLLHQQILSFLNNPEDLLASLGAILFTTFLATSLTIFHLILHLIFAIIIIKFTTVKNGQIHLLRDKGMSPVCPSC